jgi:glycosyltransferase 2 family protein
VRAPNATGRWGRVAGVAFAGVAFLFLGWFIATNVRALRAHEWTIRPDLLAASLGLQIVALAWGVLVWQLVLRALAVHAPFHVLARIRLVSGLARYIPGKIWQFVGAARLGAAAGLPPLLIVTSLLAHTCFNLAGALLIAIYALPLAAGPAGDGLALLRWLAPLLVLGLHPRVINTALRALARVLRRPLAAWTGSWATGAGIVALTVAGWLLGGAALYVFFLALTPLPAGTTDVVAINAAAFLAGHAIFITPAGLGAKEGVTAALLALHVTAPVAALLAVASRLWAVAAELVPAVLLAAWPGRAPSPVITLTTPSPPPEDRSG